MTSARSNEPIYPLPASVLQLMMEFLADDSTVGKITRGALLISATQAIQRAGPLPPKEANGEDSDHAAKQEAAKQEAIKAKLAEAVERAQKAAAETVGATEEAGEE